MSVYHLTWVYTLLPVHNLEVLIFTAYRYSEVEICCSGILVEFMGLSSHFVIPDFYRHEFLIFSTFSFQSNIKSIALYYHLCMQQSRYEFLYHVITISPPPTICSFQYFCQQFLRVATPWSLSHAT